MFAIHRKPSLSLLADESRDRHTLNSVPIDKTIALLAEHFSPDKVRRWSPIGTVIYMMYAIPMDYRTNTPFQTTPLPKKLSQAEPGYVLSIVQGEDGARLTHSHERQYNFALQSLTLWRCVLWRLWMEGWTPEWLFTWTNA